MLVSDGHSDAPDYPIAFMWEEHELAVERQNYRIATEATLFKLALGTAVAAFAKDGGKSANKHFDGIILGLTGEKVEASDGTTRRRTPRKGQGSD